MSVTPLQNDRGGEAGSPHGGQVSENYRIFDACIRSEIALPELPGARGAEPRITVATVKYGHIDLEGYVTRHDWNTDAGALLCRCARRDTDYLLTFPGRASFHLASEGVITCLPVAGATDELLRQLLLSQVLPRALAHTGALLLHASAATLPNGKTVAFLGGSGQGKSTLVSYCQKNGAQIIDDDCLLVRYDGRRITVFGGAPTVRLYPDSLRALDHDPADFAPYMANSGKQQMCLPTMQMEPRTLDALFLLEAPARDEVRIEPATGQAAMMAMLNSAFTLDPSDTDTMTRTFEHAGRVLTARGGLRVHSLHYPRDFDQLERVLPAVSDHFCQ